MWEKQITIDISSNFTLASSSHTYFFLSYVDVTTATAAKYINWWCKQTREESSVENQGIFLSWYIEFWMWWNIDRDGGGSDIRNMSINF